MQLIIIIGYSGAGKSSALRALEDIGYEAIDNIPLKALPAVVQSIASDAGRVAICSDSRAHDFSTEQFLSTYQQLRARYGEQLQLIFLGCDHDILLHRFSETRRRHPLAIDRPVSDGIAQEVTLLEPIRDLADEVIDTTAFDSHGIRRHIRARFAEQETGMRIHLLSFSYKHGLPREADLVFDVRFLRNPYYEEDLRDLTGLDDAVNHYVEADGAYTPFMTHIGAMLLPLLPHYMREGKSYLTIAIGCTGGRHRSVTVARALHTQLAQAGYAPYLRHRELKRLGLWEEHL